MAFELMIAKGECGPVKAVDSEDAKGLVCYVCEEPVHFKRKHKRSRNGISYIVREHFAHNPGSGCNGGGSLESVEHIAAKDVLVRQASTWKFVGMCSSPGCLVQIPVTIVTPGSVLKEELTWGEFRLDVGVCDGSTGETTGAIEVLHTHAFNETKENTMTTKGLAWCEVNASDVLECDGLVGATITCTRIAKTLCESCRSRIESVARQEAKRKITSFVSSLRKSAISGYIETIRREIIEREIKVREMDSGKSLSDHTREHIVQVFSRSYCDDEGGEFNMDAIAECCGPSIIDVFCDNPVDRAASEAEAKLRWIRMAIALKQNASKEHGIRTMNDRIVQCIQSLSGGVPVEEMLREHVEQLARESPEDIMTWGKYAGISIQKIYKDDPRYVVWLAGWTGERNSWNKPESNALDNTQYQTRARELLKGTCLLCYADTGETWKHWCSGCFKLARSQ